MRKFTLVSTISCFGAAIVPLCTSCNKKYTRIEWKYGDDLPANHPLSEDKVTFKDSDEAIGAYLTAVKQDDSILAKDLIYSINYWGTEQEIMGMKCDSIVAEAREVDVKNHTMSYYSKAVINASGELTTASVTMTNVTFNLVKAEDHIRILPLVYTLPESGDGTTVPEAIVALAHDKSWSMNMTDETSAGNHLFQSINYTNIVDYYLTGMPAQQMSTLWTGIRFDSQYFENAKIGE